MQLMRKNGLYFSNKICFVNVRDIAANPEQPRRHRDIHSLEVLAESIARYGVLQPLTVRAKNRKYQLVAGERRLHAAKLAGLDTVPCILLDVDSEDAALIALVENLQRKSLDYIEEAMALSELIRTFDMSQEEAARRVGRSQSAVANKLRLLKLPKDILETLRQEGLSERHARALLRLGCNDDRRRAIHHIVYNRLTVSKTEDYIDSLLAGDWGQEDKPSCDNREISHAKVGRPQFVIKDMGLLLNTVSRATEMMQQSGVDARYGKSETDTDILITIKIPKTGN